jgi:hypothetical protein
MKRLVSLLLMLVCVSALGQSFQVRDTLGRSHRNDTDFGLGGDFTADGAVPMTGNLNFGGHKGTNAADPTAPMDVATYGWVTNWVAVHGGSASDWATFTAVQDVDMAGNVLTSLGSIEFTGGAIISDTFFQSPSGFSYLKLSDSNFGIHNGEPAGVGSDINFVSDNGDVVINAANVISGKQMFTPAGALPSFVIWSDIAGGVPNANNAFAILSNGDPSDGGFLLKPNMFSQYGGSVENIGNIQGAPSDLNSVTNMAIQGEGGNLYIGAMQDDGTGATVQITGSLSVNGVLVTVP